MTETTLDPRHASLDRDLLVRVQRRDPAAMNVFFEAFIDRVYAYVVGLVRDEALADDLVQDAFVRLHGAMDRLDPGRDPSGWVFTVVTNVVRDHWRSRAHRQRGRVVDVDEAWDLADSEGDRPDRQLEATERDARVQAALGRLSPADREVVLLKQYEGLKAPEIATILEASPEAVRQRYSRAVRRLGAAYREMFGEGTTMSDERNDREPGSVSPDDQRLLDQIRQAARPRAPHALRESARRAFVEGPGSLGVPASPEVTVRHRTWAWPALAAAALLAVATLWWGGRPSDTWTVTDVVARLGVNIQQGCGNPGEHVHAGALATSDSSQIEIQLGHEVRLRLLENTRIQVPEPPGRWFGGAPSVVLEQGEIYGTTRGDLAYTVSLETAEATARLSGTTFAVFRTENATCFCLLEGALAVDPAGHPAMDLPVERRVFIYRDGRPPLVEPLTDMERDKLVMVRDGGIVDPLPQHP